MTGTDRGLPAIFRRHEFGLLGAIVAVALLTTVLDAQHNYWVHPDVSAVDLTRTASQLGLISLGAAIVIIAGGIDLSVGAVIAFSGTVCAAILLLLAPAEMLASQPLPVGAIAAAIGGAMLSGVLIGSLHAWLITVVGLPPFVATLGTLVGLRSLARAICEAVTLEVIGGTSTQINVSDQTFRALARWEFTAILLGVVTVLLAGLLGRTVIGRHLYALGGNEQAARLSGVRTDNLKWLAYCLSAVLASIAGVIAVAEQSVATPQTLGVNAELNAIAAAVVGGCSLQGGVGTMTGTVLGAVFLRFAIDGVAKIIKTGSDVYQGLIVGVLVVCAVTLTKSSDQSRMAPKLLSGRLGLVTILNLTLLAATLMALIGAKLLAGNMQLETGWLAGLTGAAALALMLILRSDLPGGRRRLLLIVWAVATVSVTIGFDRAYPGWQRSSAVSLVQQLGGKVSQNDDGLIVDLSGTRTTSSDVLRLLPRLKFFPAVAELRLAGTAVDDSLGSQRRTFPAVKIVDVTDSRMTATGRSQLKRAIPGATVRP